MSIDLHVSDIPKFAAFYTAQFGVDKKDGKVNPAVANPKIRVFYEDCVYVANIMQFFAKQESFHEKMSEKLSCLPSER